MELKEFANNLYMVIQRWITTKKKNLIYAQINQKNINLIVGSDHKSQHKIDWKVVRARNNQEDKFYMRRRDSPDSSESSSPEHPVSKAIDLKEVEETDKYKYE